MGYNLVIVESPAKTGSFEKILGPGYKCLASFGHIRELKGLKDIDVQKDYKLSFTTSGSKMKQIRKLKDAASKGSPTLLEPIMSLVVLSPDEYLGDIVSDIRTRRGKIEEMDMRGGSRILKATVPLAEMFGYATTLRTLTQGRGVFSMEYFQYEPTPPSVMEEIVARIEGRIPAAR